MNDFTGEINRLKTLVEDHLEALLPDMDPCSKTLSASVTYSLRAKGKRIRPVLLLLSCKALNGDEQDALPYACAIEYIHNYSLIHDDLPIMDDDDYRRGELTNHKVFGEAVAILAGDGLLSAAFEVIQKDYLMFFGDEEALKRRVRAGAAIIAGCGCRGMVAGQVCDIESEGKEVDSETLDFIHRNKTAALIRAAAEAGAWLGGADPETASAFSSYGENLGLAFQIADDILDTDTEDGKATYPALHGQEASFAKLRELTDTAKDSLKNVPGANAHYIDLLIDMADLLAARTK